MVLCPDLLSTRSKGDPQKGWAGDGEGYLQEGRFLSIFVFHILCKCQDYEEFFLPPFYLT